MGPTHNLRVAFSETGSQALHGGTPPMRYLEFDFAPCAALAGGSQHERRGGAVLHRHADGLVQGDLIW